MVLAQLVLCGCIGPDPDEVASASEELGGGELLRFLRGRDLFMNETFGGNGRTCSSCHLRRDVGDNFDFTPADAQALFAEDPTHPLFRSIDQDPDGSFTTLLGRGLVRIPFTLPPNVTVDELDSPLVEVDEETGAVTVTVWRSTPSIENITFEESLMWDGRFGDDLELQAVEAVRTHYEPGRDPTTQEAADIAFFQRHFFTDPQIRLWANGGPPPELPQIPSWRSGAHWDSVRRGRDFFVSMAVAPGTPVRGGQCATCHSGPMLDTTNEFNPVQPPGMKISNNFASEFGGSGLPAHTYRIALPYDFVIPPGVPIPGLPPPGTVLFPAGTVFTLVSTDPGRILTTGDPCELPLACIINSPPGAPPSTTSFMRISSLWGSADTDPFFHDNSQATMDAVLQHYNNFVFLLTSLGTGNPAWLLSPTEQQDILNYMNFAFRRRTPL